MLQEQHELNFALEVRLDKILFSVRRPVPVYYVARIVQLSTFFFLFLEIIFVHLVHVYRTVATRPSLWPFRPMHFSDHGSEPLIYR